MTRCPNCNRLVDALVTCACGQHNGCVYCIKPDDLPTLAAAGYSLEAVKKVHCLMCDQPIGDLPYKEIKTLARFGTMLFEHEECPA